MLVLHEKIIRHYITKYNGLLVKTIGDAVMVKFGKITQCIMCAVGIQSYFRNKPLHFKNSSDLLQIRIGMACGPINMRTVEVQGYKIKDFFGKTINLASRMESKVSSVGGFGILADSLHKKELELLGKWCDVKTIGFKYSCEKPPVRSGRLLLDVCHDVSLLHIDDGKEHVAYSCELK